MYEQSFVPRALALTAVGPAAALAKGSYWRFIRIILSSSSMSSTSRWELFKYQDNIIDLVEHWVTYRSITTSGLITIIRVLRMFLCAAISLTFVICSVEGHGCCSRYRRRPTLRLFKDKSTGLVAGTRRAILRFIIMRKMCGEKKASTCVD